MIGGKESAELRVEEIAILQMTITFELTAGTDDCITKSWLVLLQLAILDFQDEYSEGHLC